MSGFGTSAGAAVTTIESKGAASPELVEELHRPPSERLDYLDCVNLPHQFGQDRRLIARPGADFQHAVPGLGIEEIGHQCDQEGLRDRLAFTDRERSVLIGKGLLEERHEPMARDIPPPSSPPR
jgi:hypothetical protein